MLPVCYVEQHHNKVITVKCVLPEAILICSHSAMFIFSWCISVIPLHSISLIFASFLVNAFTYMAKPRIESCWCCVSYAKRCTSTPHPKACNCCPCWKSTSMFWYFRSNRAHVSSSCFDASPVICSTNCKKNKRYVSTPYFSFMFYNHMQQLNHYYFDLSI